MIQFVIVHTHFGPVLMLSQFTHTLTKLIHWFTCYNTIHTHFETVHLLFTHNDTVHTLFDIGQTHFHTVYSMFTQFTHTLI